MQVNEVDIFFYNDVADFIFFNNAIVVPNEVEVFYMQDVTHAHTTNSVSHQYFDLSGKTLTVSSDTNPPVTINFTRNFYTVHSLVESINNTIGVSGFKAYENREFVTLSSNTLGSGSRLTVVSSPTCLGFQVGTYSGQDQASVVVPVATQLMAVSPGMYAVNFPIDGNFVTERTYFVQILVNNIWDTDIKKFTVRNRSSYVSENFVSEE